MSSAASMQQGSEQASTEHNAHDNEAIATNQSVVDMEGKSRGEAEKDVRSWGFSHVFTWTDGPNAHYPPHSHRGLTTHLILRGSLTITYPDDAAPGKETFGPGTRLDVDAGRRHEVWMGDEGCQYVIGE